MIIKGSSGSLSAFDKQATVNAFFMILQMNLLHFPQNPNIYQVDINVEMFRDKQEDIRLEWWKD